MSFQMNEITEIPENRMDGKSDISNESKEKFDVLMSDNDLPSDLAYYKELPTMEEKSLEHDAQERAVQRAEGQNPDAEIAEAEKDTPISKTELDKTDIQETKEAEVKVEDSKDIRIQEEQDEISGCPIEGHNGHWEGERGNSKWIPDNEYTPTRFSPNGLSWKEIKEKYEIDGIEYRDGQPDFSRIAREEVKIDDFSDDRVSNFVQADEQAAIQRGCTPGEVKKWRQENGYTWHECRDCETIQKVPGEVHNNMDHSGGISMYKKMNGGD